MNNPINKPLRLFFICVFSCIALGLSACGSSGTDSPEASPPAGTNNTTAGTSAQEGGESMEAGASADGGTAGENSGSAQDPWINGFVVKESITFFVEADLSSIERYTYDFAAKSIAMVENFVSDGRESFRFAENYIYNEAGTPAVRNQSAEPGIFGPEITYMYNDQGQLVEIDYVDFKEIMSYDEDGNLIRRESVHPDTGEVLGSNIYTLRPDGRIASTETNFNGDIRVATTQYDQQDRKIGYTADDSDFREEYIYDENGNIATIIKYSSDGALTSTTNITYEATNETIYNSILWFNWFHR